MADVTRRVRLWLWLQVMEVFFWLNRWFGGWRREYDWALEKASNAERWE